MDRVCKTFQYFDPESKFRSYDEAGLFLVNAGFNAFKQLGINPKKDSLAIHYLNEAVKKYGEQGRHYHDLKHIFEGLVVLDNPILKQDLSKNQIAMITLAWIFHDYVQTFGKGNQMGLGPEYTDEKTSADHLAFVARSEMGVLYVIVEVMFNMIMQTNHKHFSPTGLSSYICDVDLLRLAAPPEYFDAYSNMVFDEYGVSVYEISEAMPLRIAALQPFLDRQSVYATFIGQPFEAAARENLRKMGCKEKEKV